MGTKMGTTKPAWASHIGDVQWERMRAAAEKVAHMAPFVSCCQRCGDPLGTGFHACRKAAS